MPNTCCVGFYHLPHIGPSVFEVASASKGLLLEVVEMEKKDGEGVLPEGEMHEEERRLFSLHLVALIQQGRK